MSVDVLVMNLNMEKRRKTKKNQYHVDELKRLGTLVRAETHVLRSWRQIRAGGGALMGFSIHILMVLMMKSSYRLTVKS